MPIGTLLATFRRSVCLHFRSTEQAEGVLGPQEGGTKHLRSVGNYILGSR